MEINADYVIRRTIMFDNKCGFVLGENPKAPNPYVTWQFNEQDGHRDYFWGHYHNEPDMAERDLHNRAEDYQRRYHVQEVEQAPDKETYKYYSTQRPIDIGTYPKSYFNRPIHMDVYFTRQQVPGEAFQAWGAITYAQPLTDREMRDYELRPARENLDIRRQMDAQAQVVGKWEDAHHVPEQRRLTWFYPDFGRRVCHPGAACRPCSWGGAPSGGQGPQGGQAADCPADENCPKTGRGAPGPDRPQEVCSPP